MLQRASRNGFLLSHARSSLRLCPVNAASARLLRRRNYASVAEISSEAKVGDRIHGFTVNRVKHVPELHLTALHLEHAKTGAEYLHVARDDKNNVFAINFKTNPTDATGLPHILEHITLCGSEKYPVRDPFFKMMPRSLSNFMNAFTSSDYTSYPFATTNKQDFRNLSSVYLDATLRPLLKHSDFLQEGWRLGPENPRDTASRENVQFKGVVYNEMKGQMSDASYLYYIRFREHIFPSLHNSGGDPEKMTDLTHRELVDFSRKHYHPSNARFFSYGDLDLKDHLGFVEQSLEGFDRIAPDKEIKFPRSLDDKPLSFKVMGPIDTMQSLERQTKSSVTWLGGATSDIVETFSLSIISSLLMSGYGSPLYQGLIETGLGSNFSPNTGYDTSSPVGIFSIGLDGMKSDDVPNLKTTIQTILREKSADSFLPHKIEGYMHQLEIALKHKTASFGMGLLDKTLPSWLNGVDPMDTLAWNEVVPAFRSRLEEDRYLEKLVEKYLRSDSCLIFTIEPSETYNETIENQEEQRREAIISQLESQETTPGAAIQQLGKQELELLHEQESAQTKNLETLPSVHVSDVSRTKEKKPLEHSKVGSVDCLWRKTSTNGITYFQAKHMFQGLPNDLRLLLPLFTEAVMRLGTKAKTVGDLEADILLKTGGISVSPFTRPDPWSLDKFSEGLNITGYALDRNVPDMLDLVKTLLLEIDFSGDNVVDAIQELLESKTSGALDSVAESGNHFAITTASAALSWRGYLQEQLSGLSQIEANARLLAQARDDPDAFHQVIEKLKLIQSLAVSNSSALSLRVVCEPDSATSNEKNLAGFLKGLPEQPRVTPTLPDSGSIAQSSLSKRAYFDLPFQVSYTGACLQTVPYAHDDKAALTILGQLLTHNRLHAEVREKGGAYGASASASPISGLFSMSSYRDPNPRNSLQVFKEAGVWARDRQWSPREIEEGKISVFQQVDAPTSVQGDGGAEFMYGITEEMEQVLREKLLDVTNEDVQAVAQKYLVDTPAEAMALCILGEKKDWVDADAERWDIKELKMST